MNQYAPGLIEDITQPAYPGVPRIASEKIDLEKILALSLIRTHTKTDDVPHVTDEQLVLYRKTAFEVCEQYTGLLFTRRKPVQESVAIRPGKRWRNSYIHRMRYPSADGRVYLYAGHQGFSDRVIDIAPGASEIRIPVIVGAFNYNSCCDPCRGDQSINYGMSILYHAGLDDCENVPGGIIVGVLKFIAWLIINPGDEILTVRNRASSAQTGIIGTNNGAWASGAIEQWRVYVAGAI